MGDRQKAIAPEHTEKPFQRRARRPVNGIMLFGGGLVAALVLGWFLFPWLLYATEDQPVAFSHKVHLKDASLRCAQCHHLRADGSFTGLPETRDCVVCHARLLGNTPEERRFFDEYVRSGKDVPWLVYQYQPDNVFFSHAAHSAATCNVCHQNMTEERRCALCHLNVMNSDSPPPLRKNRVSGYSANTMKMWQCEQCHARPTHLRATNANNACFVCHK